MRTEARVQVLLDAYDQAGAEVRKSRDLLAQHLKAWKAGDIGEEYLRGIAASEAELATVTITQSFRLVGLVIRNADLAEEYGDESASEVKSA